MAMPNILIGTASWTDLSLLHSGRFYPPEAKTSEDKLRYYAAQFPFVEVDSSYSSLPSVLPFVDGKPIVIRSIGE